MDQNEENELLRITQNTDAVLPVKSWGMLIFNKRSPRYFKTASTNETAMINRRYSEIVDYPLPSTLCKSQILLARRHYRFH